MKRKSHCEAWSSIQVLIALLFGFLSVSCELLHPTGRGPKKTAREAQGLLGPVLSVFVASASPLDTNGVWEPGEQKPVSMDSYDKQGKRTTYLAYAADGTVRQKVASSYDAQGNEIETVRYDTHDTVESRTVSLYDTEGRGTEARFYTADGTLSRRTVVVAEAREHEAVTQSYDSQGALESRTVSTHDASGNLTDTTWSYADGKPGGQTVYRRDGKGLLLSFTTFVYTPDGALQSRTDATCDVRGNPTEVIWYGESGRFKSTERSTYRYDVFGNWVQRTTTISVVRGDASSFAPPVVTYRTITYYGKGTE